MIIRTLKAVLISVALITFASPNNEIKSTPTQPLKSSTKKQPTINELNKLIKKSSETLNNISSILEFVAQAINKGTIVVKNKALAKKWVKNNLDNINMLENYLNDFDIDIIKIYKVNGLSKFLIAHIHSQLEKQLDNPKAVEINLQSDTFKKLELEGVTPKVTNDLINQNAKRINALQDKANSIGLTFGNKAARWVEQINDKYRITRMLGIIPPITLLSLATLYYMPLHWFGTEQIVNNSKTTVYPVSWFSKIPYIEHIKKVKECFIGGSKYTDKTYKAPNANNGLLHAILSIFDKDFGKISIALSALVAYANRDSLATTVPQAGEFISATRDFWQRLKGYEVKSRSLYQIIEGLTLRDERIIGLEDQIEELEKMLEYIANPEIYDKQQSGPSKAMMIVGPSGNGKTLLAKAVAGSLNELLKNKGLNTRIAFKEIKWTEIVWTKEGLKKVIDQAKAHTPCILFFDEFHLFPLQSKEGGPTLSDLLTELDGVNAASSASNQIIFLAATNQPEMLDSALLRSGRFGTIIRVKKPNFKSRKKYFEVMCKRFSIDTKDIDFNLLAKQTVGCSYSDLDSILKDARFTARREIRRTSQKHIQDRIIRHVYRLTDKSTLSDFERKHLAANKAGSALLHLLLKPQEQLELVTIKGRWKKIKEGRFWDNEVRRKMYTTKNIKYGGIFTYNPNEELGIVDDQEKIKQCKIRMASYLAEEILLKCRTSKAGNNGNNSDQKNKQKALELIKSTLYETFEEDFMSKKMKQDLKEKIYATFKQYEQEVKDLLMQHHSLLSTIASALEEKELLTMADLKELMRIAH